MSRYNFKIIEEKWQKKWDDSYEFKTSIEEGNNTQTTASKNFSGYRVDKHLRQITALVDPQQFEKHHGAEREVGMRT